MNPTIADMEGSKPMDERQLLENEIKELLLKAVTELEHNTYIASILIKKALRKLEKINAFQANNESRIPNIVDNAVQKLC